MRTESESESNVWVFVLAMILSVVSTLTAYWTLRPDNVQSSSKVIIFRHPENAS